MRKLVFGALALSAATAPGFASETDWLSLDSELEALSANLADNGETAFGGYIITSFNFMDDAADADANTAGFNVNKARIHAKKKFDNGYSVKVQGDFASAADGVDSDGDAVSGGFGTFKIKDAYVRFPAGDLNGTFGHFRTPFLRSGGTVSSSRTFFLTRTLNGGEWSRRDAGAQIAGKFDKLDYTLAAMNSDGGDTSFLYTARLGFQVTGSELNSWEGAYGYDSNNPSVYVAVAYADDDASRAPGDGLDSNAFAFEAHAVTNVYSVSFETVTYGDGGLDDYGTVDNSPMSLTATYMLTPDTWELGIRYDDMDNDDNTNKITIGANHYLNGHALKWTYQYEMISSDDDDAEDTYVRVGLIASF